MTDVANRPGHIQYVRGQAESYTGCFLHHFITAAEFNTWAQANPGFLVVEVKPLPNGELMVLYTKALTKEEEEDLDAWGRDMQAFISERKAMREEAAESAKAAEEKEKAENARLLILGKKCEQNHKKDFSPDKEAKKLAKGKG